MSGPTSANRSLGAAALVGPRKPPPAASRGIPHAPLQRLSLEAYLRARAAPDRVVLCPPGRSLAGDLAFLKAARARLLWPAPPRDIGDAIAGLVTAAATPAAPPARRLRAPRRPAGSPPAALLLEGAVTNNRARAALASPARLWVVESVRCVRISEANFELLKREGVQWAALRPVELTGLVCSAALLRALRRRKPRLPRRAKLWHLRASEAPSRRPSPR